MRVHPNTKGFTLVETIIYIALFAILFTGIFISIYPLFTSAERLSENILAEGETTFILAKIRHALSNTITTPLGEITTPDEGETADELVLKWEGNELFHFTESGSFCGGPSVCQVLALELNGSGDPFPLNATRIEIEDFEVTHVAPSGDVPRYLDISFSVNGRPMAPVRYYVRF